MTPSEKIIALVREQKSSLSLSDEDARRAVRLLLEWIGEDPDREGLFETPARFIRAWKEYFSGYDEDPVAVLRKTFEEVDGYNDMVVLDGVRLFSTCEHHLAPMVGKACIAYLPRHRVVGISKLARAADILARRMQIQERLTAQIAHAIDEALEPLGVAVAVRASHSCIGTRGAFKPESDMLTVTTLGAFETDPRRRAEFMALANGKGSA